MKRKILSILMLFVMALSVLSPISLAKKDVLRIGMEVNYAPFNWAQVNDKDGAIAVSNSEGEFANGYDVQIAKRIADDLGMELEIIKTEWDGLPPAVMSGKIDLIIAGMSPTEERKKEIDFSESYYTSDLVIVLQKDSPYAKAKSLPDFKDAKITGQLNTFHYTVIDQIQGVRKMEAMESFPSMISAVNAGKIDGYVSEKPGAMSAVVSNPKLTYVEFSEGQGFETSSEDTSIAVGVKKGSPLTEQVNQSLTKISEEERQDIMEQMVVLNTKEESGSFLDRIQMQLKNYGPLFINGALRTLFIAIISTLAGFGIGLMVAVLKTIHVKKSKNAVGYYMQKLVSVLLSCYIEIFRGTPMMVQAILIYYGGKEFFNIDMHSMTAALLIVSINTGAYLSEVVRGGINSIDAGQKEACQAIGMTHWQMMLYVVLPQAVRNILPAIGNEFVINIKDTSVLNVISVTELFFISKSVAGSTYQVFEAYAIACIIYFVLTFTTTRILLFLERRMYNQEFVMESSTGGRTNE